MTLSRWMYVTIFCPILMYSTRELLSEIRTQYEETCLQDSDSETDITHETWTQEPRVSAFEMKIKRSFYLLVFRSALVPIRYVMDQSALIAHCSHRLQDLTRKVSL